jgi:hypothetical protein
MSASGAVGVGLGGVDDTGLDVTGPGFVAETLEGVGGVGVGCTGVDDRCAGLAFCPKITRFNLDRSPMNPLLKVSFFHSTMLLSTPFNIADSISIRHSIHRISFSSL